MTAAELRSPAALVLHDDAHMAAHVDGLLVALGYRVDVVQSAFQLLRRDATPPQLIILAATALEPRDRDVVPLLREIAPAALILVLYPANLRDRAAELLAAGADATLSEPFYPSELSAHARRALASPTHVPLPTSKRTNCEPPTAASPIADSTADDTADETAHESAGTALAPQSATPVQQIAVGVAHAVRNPLQIMELMLATAETGDELDLDALREAMTRIADVAGDLARFGDQTRSTPTPIEVQPLIRGIFDPIRGKSSPDVLVDAPEDLIVAMAEPELLRSALEILRDRALRRTPRDGVIGVRVRVAGENVSIAVSDGGERADEAQLRHFFEPDPDVDVVQAGTWLEMAVLAGMVHAQSGSVSVTSGAESGLVVTLRLPISDKGGDVA